MRQELHQKSELLQSKGRIPGKTEGTDGEPLCAKLSPSPWVNNIWGAAEGSPRQELNPILA